MADWTVGINEDLEFGPDRPWDGADAARRVFELAGFGTESVSPEIARQAFLVYDAEAPELRGSYRLGIADVIDGELYIMPAGMRAAASRLPQTDIPEAVANRAREALDRIVARMQEEENDEQDSAKDTLVIVQKVSTPGWMQANVRRGLEWYAEGRGGDGLMERTVNEARAMARGQISEDKLRRMAAWFPRHMVDLDAPAANPDHEDYPSPGVVAHALWGGGTRQQSERAMTWSRRQVEQLTEERSTMTTRQKLATFEILEATKAAGAIRITTPSLDRDRDRVMPLGGLLDAYRKNPIVQWGHQYNEPWQTIGRTTDISVTPDGIDVLFELRDPVNAMDPMHVVRQLWNEKLINTASIGFRPLEAKPNDDGGLDFTSWELFEWSLVPIPANRDAVRLMSATKAAKDGFLKAGRVLSKANEARLREAYEAIGAVLEQLGEDGGEKTGIPPQETAVDDRSSDDVTALAAALTTLRMSLRGTK